MLCTLDGQQLSGMRTPRPVQDGSAKLIGHYDPTQKLRLVIGLRPPHVEEEEEFVKELHTKGSPQFHHFLTADEWNSRFAPSAVDEKAVVQWAESQGLTVTHQYPNRLLVDFEAPVAVIERALNVKINNYRLGSSDFFSNDRDPELPLSLAGEVQAVLGLNNVQKVYSRPGAKQPGLPDYVPGPVLASSTKIHSDADRTKLPSALQQPHSKAALAFTPDGDVLPKLSGYDPTEIYSSEAYDYQALYNQGHCCNPLNNPGNSPPESSIAIAAFGAVNPNDIIGFHNQYPYLAYNIELLDIDGTPLCCDNEATADTEFATAMANSFGLARNTAKVWVYQGANYNYATFVDVYNFMLTDGVARIFSTSYPFGGVGAEYLLEDDPFAVEGMLTAHAIFNQMVGQGWTLVAAAGDDGVTDGCSQVSVDYPSSDGNVVAAGGTELFLNSDGSYNFEWAYQWGPPGCGGKDGGGGGGVSTYWQAPPYQVNLPGNPTMRQVPDLALNANWYNTPQHIYFNGLSSYGGTSIVAPELAGFFAQENAYLLFLGNVCGNSGTDACAPMGNVNYYIYNEGLNPSYAPHYPFYDITQGCNNNDITEIDNLPFYCAGVGYANVTGWGSANMLQLAWAINYSLSPDSGAPSVQFFGPATHRWYNSNQIIGWTVTDTGAGFPPSGVAGFSAAWDSDPGDSLMEATPGSDNSFYSGPQFPNITSGALDLNHLGELDPQGCHTVNIRAWDNLGQGGNHAYGPICYDTIPPVTTAALSGTLSCPSIYAACYYVSPVTMSLTATDNASGVASTSYQVNGGPRQTYIPCVGAQSVSAQSFISHPTCGIFVAIPGNDTVIFFSTDKAGNVEQTKSVSFTIVTQTSTLLKSSRDPSVKGQAVTFTATVTPSFGGPPNGTVTFKNGATILAVGKVNSATDQISFTTSTLSVGTHSITAVFKGDSGHFGSTSPVIKQVVEE